MESTVHAKWYAIKTRYDFRLAKQLLAHCQEVYFPTRQIKDHSGGTRCKAVIPHVLFILTDTDTALRLERQSRSPETCQGNLPPFWIYRNSRGGSIQPISESQIKLLRLLTAPEPERCEIYNKTDYQGGERVRITGGIYAGYEGVVRRVRKNRHVVVAIQGLCLILLPYLHPDLLEPIP